MTKETFIARLKRVKEQYEELNKKHDLMVEQNPFVEDGSGVMPKWLTDLIFEHVVTLFAAINEKAFYKTRLDTYKENSPGKSLEEIAKELGISIGKLSEEEKVNELEDLADYFMWEMDWGGSISIGENPEKNYDLSDYGRLYDYIKEEI